MMRLYLDIDGVLLDRKGNVPEGAEALLRFATSHFQCHWLTTHCKGNAETALRYLSRHYPERLLPLFQGVLATDWDAMKTEGIDFEEPFIWLEDRPFQAEIAQLGAKGMTDSLIIVDLSNAGELDRVRAALEFRLRLR